jgi:hypothetical protein
MEKVDKTRRAANPKGLPTNKKASNPVGRNEPGDRMENPGLPVIGPEREFRLVATTTSLSEANAAAEQYELQGFETKITRDTKAGITLYKVWVAKSPDILQGVTAAGSPKKARGGGPRGKLPKL